MKSDLFFQGTVFKYPYLWHRDSRNPGPEPKDRTVCLILKFELAAGNTQLAILPVSDRPSKEKDLSVPVPEAEKRLAGLSEFREAYVHVGETNFDHAENSLSFNPNASIMGRFSKPFVSMLAKALAKNVRDKRVLRVDRN